MAPKTWSAAAKSASYAAYKPKAKPAAKAAAATAAMFWIHRKVRRQHGRCIGYCSSWTFPEGMHENTLVSELHDGGAQKHSWVVHNAEVSSSANRSAPVEVILTKAELDEMVTVYDSEFLSIWGWKKSAPCRQAQERRTTYRCHFITTLLHNTPSQQRRTGYATRDYVGFLLDCFVQEGSSLNGGNPVAIGIGLKSVKSNRSNEKGHWVVFGVYRGWNPTQLCGDYKKVMKYGSHWVPIKQPGFNGKYPAVFFLGSNKGLCLCWDSLVEI